MEDSLGCWNCGHSFAAADRFCSRCGLPILPEDHAWAAGWQTCALHIRNLSSPLFGPWRWRFIAVARRPESVGVVAESPDFAARTTVTKRTPIRLAYLAPPPSGAAHDARTALVRHLEAEGWEQTAEWPGASEWFAQLFRKRRL